MQYSVLVGPTLFFVEGGYSIGRSHHFFVEGGYSIGRSHPFFVEGGCSIDRSYLFFLRGMQYSVLVGPTLFFVEGGCSISRSHPFFFKGDAIHPTLFLLKGDAVSIGPILFFFFFLKGM
jgi:hypothetical protein